MNSQLASSRTRVSALLRRSRVAAWWGAYLAVRSRVRLDEYLDERVGAYRRNLLAQGIRLPVEVLLQEGRLRFRQLEDAVPAPVLEGGIEANLASADGPEAVAQLHEAEQLSESHRLRAELGRQTVAARRRELADALASGVAASAEVREHLPRPRVPGLIGPGLVFAFAAILLLAEAWQTAVPLLDMTGIDASDMAAEAQRAPMAVFLGLAFAVGATSVLVYLAHLTVRALARAVEPFRGNRTRALDGLAAAAFGVLIGAFAWSLSAMRHASSQAGAELAASMAGGSATETTHWTFFLLVALLPFFGVALWDFGTRALTRRAAALDAAHQAEHDLSVREETRKRLLESIAVAERELETVESEHSSARQTAVMLRSRGTAAMREEVRLARLDSDRIASAREDLAAVLEVDRYAFVRRASRLGLRSLVGEGTVVVGRPEPSARRSPVALRPEVA